MKERQKSVNRLTRAFENLVNVLSTGKKRARDYGTGDLIFTAEAHHISIIGRNPGITAKAIVQKMGITKGAVSQVLRKLKEKDYIIKYPKADNLREFCLNLTKKGQIAFKAHESSDQKLVESLSKHLESLNPEQIEKVSDMVSELSDYLKESETI
ncbi:MAG: MarR family transcriptional regulator [Deltaproteobacteria bacterium]|nr:MarR family transcriptional regulator [Deltaproteobacteria bacterium]